MNERAGFIRRRPEWIEVGGIERRADAARFPNVRQIEDGGSLALSFAGAKPTRPVSKPLSDIAGRVAWMQKQGIDKQVVGGWVDMFGY